MTSWESPGEYACSYNGLLGISICIIFTLHYLHLQLWIGSPRTSFPFQLYTWAGVSTPLATVPPREPSPIALFCRWKARVDTVRRRFCRLMRVPVSPSLLLPSLAA